MTSEADDYDRAEEIDALIIDRDEHLAAKDAEIAKLRALLERCEWPSVMPGYCAICDGTEPGYFGGELDGHEAGCELAAALGRETKPATDPLPAEHPIPDVRIVKLGRPVPPAIAELTVSMAPCGCIVTLIGVMPFLDKEQILTIPRACPRCGASVREARRVFATSGIVMGVTD